MLYIGADHNGYFLKEKLKRHLQRKNIVWQDCGAFAYKKTDDYVDFARQVISRMKAGDKGLLICGSGHGMAIAANKGRGIRAIAPRDEKSAFFGRRDDHANVLVLAAWQVDGGQAERIVETFLKTRPGKAARYLRRLKKISRLES